MWKADAVATTTLLSLVWMVQWSEAMRLVIDLDGVCYEFDKTARYMLRTMRGCQGLEDPSREWFMPNQDWHDVSDKDWEWLWSEGVEKGLFRYGHMVRDTRVALEALVQAGHTIELATSRPASAVSDTIAWVDLYFKDIPLRGLHILSDRQDKSTVGGDVLVDDRPANFMHWPTLGVLFDREWNQGVEETPRLRRARGWGDVVRTIRQFRTD